MKKTIAFCLLPLLVFCIGALFWHQQYVYSLPTPVPENYKYVKANTWIDIGKSLPGSAKRPVLLHFFNPECPCSRFNIRYFNALTRQYRSRLDFAVIVMTSNKKYTAAAIREKFDLEVPVMLDSSLARTCGVYSTPQAVILNSDHRIYYRGNYNKSKYCTDKKSNYAQIAIDSLLASTQLPSFNQFALTAYGCSLPGCKKN